MIDLLSIFATGLFVDSSLVLLQFVLLNLTVVAEDDLEEKYPDGTLHFPFKHGNWEDFLHHMDEGLQRNYYDQHEENPKFGLVWLGKRLMPLF
jgi:hypothetical protein